MRFVLFTLGVLFVAGCSSEEPVARHIDMPGSNAAMAPRTSSLQDGRLLLSWIEPANGEAGQDALRFAIHDGSRWSESRTARTGKDWFTNWADTAGVTALDNGLLVAHWLQKNGAATYAYEVRYSVSEDGGETWSEPRRAHDDGSASEHGFVSVLPRGQGFEMYWLDGRKTVNEGGMTLRLGRFTRNGRRELEREVDGLTCDCCPTDAVRQGDDSLVVYRDRDSEERRDIFMARVLPDGSVERHEVNDDAWTMPACPVNGPAIVERNGEVSVLWFTAANGAREIRFTRGTPEGEFQPAHVLASGDVHGRVQLLSSGDSLLALWLAGRGSEGRLELAEIDAGKARTLAVVRGLSVARGVGYPLLAELPGGDLLLAWTGEGNSNGLEGRRIVR